MNFVFISESLIDSIKDDFFSAQVIKIGYVGTGLGLQDDPTSSQLPYIRPNLYNKKIVGSDKWLELHEAPPINRIPDIK